MNARDDAAKRLSDLHYQVETGLTHIYRIRADVDQEAQPDEPIKLLEVNEDTIAAGIMPLGFGPADELGIPFSSVIVEITPDEYRQLQSAELSLPDGWMIDALVPRPVEASR